MYSEREYSQTESAKALASLEPYRPEENPVGSVLNGIVEISLGLWLTHWAWTSFSQSGWEYLLCLFGAPSVALVLAGLWHLLRAFTEKSLTSWVLRWSAIILGFHTPLLMIVGTFLFIACMGGVAIFQLFMLMFA